MVADNAFPLMQHIMKPFPHQNQNLEQRVFSYRLSRARHTIENSLGILAHRFQVFQKPINLGPKKVQQVLLACTALHNYLREAPVTPNLFMDASAVNREQMPGNYNLMLPLAC